MKKKIIIFLVMIILIAGAIVGGYFYFNQSESQTFTVEEEQWLEKNKNNVVDIYIPRDILGFTYMGDGVFFDFITELEKRTNLTFNKVAYEAFDDVSSQNYAIEIVDTVLDNQVSILSDNYIILSKKNQIYISPEEIQGLKIGVLEENKEEAQKYLDGSVVEWVSYESEEELLTAFESDNSTLDAIVGLRSLYLDEILSSQYHVAYHISEMKKTYVLTLNGDTTLNSIIKKTYQKWSKENLDTSYNSNLLDAYFEYKGVTSKERTTLREKSYVYAFVNNGAYDEVKSGNLNGINYYIIKSFAEFANIDMEYETEYKNQEELESAFQEGKIDFYFHNSVHQNIENYYDTVTPITAKAVIVTNVNKTKSITSIYSLEGKKVAVVKDTFIAQYLTNHGIKVKTYDSLEELLKSKNNMIAIDLENYEYYKTTSFVHYKISYTFSLDENYGYTVQEEDQLFAELLDFYLEYMPVQDIIQNGYHSIFMVTEQKVYYWIAIIILAFLVLIQFLGNTKKVLSFMKKRKKRTLTKDEKIRYIDSLTSLKNRAYLNDNIEKWDNSEVYPQVIVIVDLNNIAYINDNFGHEEGDKVITEAANILIQTQMPRSEIIRTDGNEFLIYLVEYDEKQVNTYIRKLSKELKDISHEFGAAIGYSVINDEIKTIDDAVNEATLDMRANKEAMTEEEK